ncbi:MAG: hypothetical protein H7231_09080 [Rhodoferax sp.]|nr:hypothetical protein [Actinomycetota bacterium]
MNLPEWLLGLLVLALLAWYLSFSAARIDRLHHRVEGGRSALDAQLVRRAEAAVELAGSGALDPASGLLVAGAATDALDAGELADAGTPPPTHAGEPSRETAESDLSHALQLALDPDLVTAMREDPIGAALLERLRASCHRVQLARRFHNDAVTDATRVRAKPIARWARLAGRAQAPQTFEMDDEPPVALTR